MSKEGGNGNKWTTIKLKEISDKVGSGATPRGGKNSYKSEGVPLIRSMNVHFDGFREEGLVFLDDEQASGLDNVRVSARDVLFNITGASIGRVTTAPIQMEGARVNQHVCIIRPNEPLDASFLRWLLASPEQQAFIMREQTGATRQALTKEKILDFQIPLPALNEQRRIVAKIEELFSDLDAGVAALERAKANLKRYRAAVLKAAVEGRLTAEWRADHPDVEPASELMKRLLTERRQRWEQDQLAKYEAKGKKPPKGWKDKYKEPPPPDTRNLPELPPNWCWVAAEQLTAPSRSIMYGIIKAGPDTPGGVPYVRVMEMKTGTIDVSKLKRCHPDRAAKFERATLMSGDILVSKDGTIGKVAIVPPELEGGNITQHVMRFSTSPHVDARFVGRAIEAPLCQSWMKGETKGVALQGVNVEDFRQMPIPLPPLHEQIAIRELVDDIVSVVENNETQIEKAETRSARLRQAILKRGFSGQLVPQDSGDEPASELLKRVQREAESNSTPKKKSKRNNSGKKDSSAT